MKPIERPVCLTIAGLDPSGGAGVIADVKTFSAFDCFAAAAVTSITFQNTTGVFGASHQSAETLRMQVQPILDDYSVAAVKTGMLPTPEIIEETATLLTASGIANIVIDPVVRSTSGFDLIDDDALRALIERLFPLASIVTPNIPEAERICGIIIECEKDITAAGQEILGKGAKAVLIKGGHPYEGVETAVDHLFTVQGHARFEGPYIRRPPVHGTGCALSAAIAANLALGSTLSDSITIGKAFVLDGIEKAEAIGKGNSPVYISPNSQAG